MGKQRAFRCTIALLGAVLLAGCGKAEGNEDEPKSSGGGAKLVAMPAGTGTIRGKARFEKYVAPKPQKVSSTDSVCLGHFPDGVVLEKYMMNEDRTLPHVFVYVKSVGGTPLEKVWKFDVPSEPAHLDQLGCRYVPHVLGLMKGQAIRVTNSDKTAHNIHWQGKRNRWGNFVQNYKNETRSKPFKKTEHSYFKCDVHSWMSCQVHILPHTVFAVTGADGTFELPRLPVGDYELVAMHEKWGKLTEKVTIAATGDPKPVTFEFKK